MAELLQEYSTKVLGSDKTEYVVRSYGEERTDGTWKGWLEFEPTDSSRRVGWLIPKLKLAEWTRRFSVRAENPM